MSVGVAKRGSADGAFLPFDFAGGEVNAEQGLRGCAVKEVAHLGSPADGRRQLGFEVELLRFNAAIFWFQFYRAAASAGIADINNSIARQRRRNVRPIAADGFAIAPKEFARLC